MSGNSVLGSPNFKAILKPLIIFRVLNAVLIGSFFQADEFWQCLEPAHYKAFGYGALTWEWKEGLRSYAFPFIFELVYYICRAISFVSYCVLLYCEKTLKSAILQFDILQQQEFFWEVCDYLSYLTDTVPNDVEYYMVYYLPKIAMAILAAIAEFYTIAWIYKVYLLTFAKKYKNDGNSIIKIATLLTLSNFFNCFFITRTFMNSFEMCITSVALYYWPWSNELNEINSSGFKLSLFLGMFMILQRPTNALIWICLGMFLVIKLLWKKRIGDFRTLVRNVLVFGFYALVLNCAIDFYFYKTLCFPIFRFIKFNVTSSLSSFYGQSPWHFHIAQSFPIITGLSLPLVVYAMILNFKTPNNHIFNILKFVVCVNVFIFSLIKHKEFRFLYPLQPVFTLMSTFSVFELWKKYNLNIFSIKYLIFPIGSALLALLVCSFQETGVIEVMNILHAIPHPITSVGFVMPCHSTPWQSHLHRNDIESLWAITCEPPLHLLDEIDASAELESYMDESDYLYDDIPLFLYTHFPPVFRKGLRSPGKKYSYEWPEYLVVFEHLDEAYVKDLLAESPYYEYSRIFNSYSHWDSRRSGDVIVYHKEPWK